MASIIEWTTENIPLLTFLLTVAGAYFLWRSQSSGAKGSLAGAVGDMVTSFRELSNEFEEYRENAKKENSALRADFEAYKHKNEKEKRELLSRLADVEAERDELRENYKSSQKDYQAAMKKIASLEETNTALKNALDKYNGKEK